MYLLIFEDNTAKQTNELTDDLKQAAVDGIVAIYGHNEDGFTEYDPDIGDFVLCSEVK